MNDRQWSVNGHDHGAALARDLGYQPAYLHYNTGLHVSTNGAELAHLICELVSKSSTEIDEIAIVGHSMGGLVARSACHVAEKEALAWREKLHSIVFLGAPHHGSPLERAGNWADTLLGANRYSAPLSRLGKIRSAGVTDLRYGNVLDEHWRGRDRFEMAKDDRAPLPLPEGVACFAIAGSAVAGRSRGVLPDDGLVPVSSALGQHKKSHLTLAFPDSHTWIGKGVMHMQLLSDAEVYRQIHSWLESRILDS
jgi:pimeloyl-ACP methyl ester carboxylesterase